MGSFDLNTPLDAGELDDISKRLYLHEFISLKQSLCMGTPVEKRQYKENAAQMLNTWHSNQDPAKERWLLIMALNKSGLHSLAQIVHMGVHRQDMTPITQEPFNNHQHPTPPPPTYEPVVTPTQQPHRAPLRVPQQNSYEITEIKLRDISIKLGCEWRAVGTYLGFSNSQIEVMQEEYRVVKECIFQMLLQWRNTNGVKATKEKFKKTLRRSQREDLADFIDEADD